jgi:hypothetical protein
MNANIWRRLATLGLSFVGAHVHAQERTAALAPHTWQESLENTKNAVKVWDVRSMQPCPRVVSTPDSLLLTTQVRSLAVWTGIRNRMWAPVQIPTVEDTLRTAILGFTCWAGDNGLLLQHDAFLLLLRGEPLKLELPLRGERALQRKGGPQT